MGAISELGDVVKGFTGLSVIYEFIICDIPVPSDTIVNLAGGVVIVPFHGWVISQKSLELGQFEDTGLIWKSGGGEDEIISQTL